MPMLNPTTVMTEPAVLIWDAASKHDADPQTGKITWGVTVAIRKDSTTYAEMKTAADAEIKRVYPTGAPHGFKQWDKSDFDPQKYPELSPAEYVFVRFSSKDAKGTYHNKGEIPREEFGRLVYPGCKVEVLGHCWCYTKSPETANQTGLKWFFDGVSTSDLTTPKLSVSKGMSQTQVAAAFGAAPSAAAAFTSAPAAAAAPAPTPAAPLAPNPGIVPPVPTPKLAGIGQTVESMQAAGWTVEQMRAEGYVM